jgi:hypothetical protein
MKANYMINISTFLFLEVKCLARYFPASAGFQ